MTNKKGRRKRTTMSPKGSLLVPSTFPTTIVSEEEELLQTTETEETTEESSDDSFTDGDNNNIDERMVSSPFRVFLLGITILSIGTNGFYCIPGMMDDENTENITANSSSRLIAVLEDSLSLSYPKLVNAFYCSVITMTT